MFVRFNKSARYRLGMRNVELAAGQIVEVEWSMMERYAPGSYEIVDPKEAAETVAQAKADAERAALEAKAAKDEADRKALEEAKAVAAAAATAENQSGRGRRGRFGGAGSGV